jgi:putative transposase
MLVKPMVEHSVSQMMQSLEKRYVYYINKTYKRTSTLREGRYKASLIDSDHYLMTCMRYIELNAVRVNMVLYTANTNGQAISLLRRMALIH